MRTVAATRLLLPAHIEYGRVGDHAIFVAYGSFAVSPEARTWLVRDVQIRSPRARSKAARLGGRRAAPRRNTIPCSRLVWSPARAIRLHKTTIPWHWTVKDTSTVPSNPSLPLRRRMGLVTSPLSARMRSASLRRHIEAQPRYPRQHNSHRPWIMFPAKRLF